MVDLDETVTAAQSGCPNAFNDLVKATYNDTYVLALRLVGNAEDARDVVQDTYLRAFRAISRFRGESAIGTWLFRITSNCAHNVIRRRRPTEPLVDANTPMDNDPTRDPEAAAEGNELRARLMMALATLPTKLREVVELRELADLSHDAIAKRLGISESAAKVRLHRARARLREMFAADELPENVVSLASRSPVAGPRFAAANNTLPARMSDERNADDELALLHPIGALDAIDVIAALDALDPSIASDSFDRSDVFDGPVAPHRSDARRSVA